MLPSRADTSQVALTLRAVGGLTTAQIARALLVPETTMTRRISRAKRRIAAAGATFGPLSGSERDDRLGAVLRVLYLIFNAGYAATAGAARQRALIGPCQIQAAIAAVRAEAPCAEDPDWRQVLALYELLERIAPSPMVRLNHAVAAAMVKGPQAGLAAGVHRRHDQRHAGAARSAARRHVRRVGAPARQTEKRTSP